MQKEASFIIRNARILTMDEANPRAEAIALSGNRILAVGSEAQIDAFSGPDTHVIDARGATVLPGFNEAHMHIFGGSVELTELSLYRVKGFEALEKAVKAYAAANPDRRLLIAQHADYTILSDEERLTRHHLDRILPDRPLLIVAPDHHVAWANTIALKQAGILEGRDVGVGNEIVMGEDGLANGELRESNAIRPVSALGETGGREMLGVGTGGEPENVTPEERACLLRFAGHHLHPEHGREPLPARNAGRDRKNLRASGARAHALPHEELHASLRPGAEGGEMA
jgi:predicted amidohydrolase YtcJ